MRRWRLWFLALMTATRQGAASCGKNRVRIVFISYPDCLQGEHGANGEACFCRVVAIFLDNSKDVMKIMYSCGKTG